MAYLSRPLYWRKVDNISRHNCSRSWCSINNDHVLIVAALWLVCRQSAPSEMQFDVEGPAAPLLRAALHRQCQPIFAVEESYPRYGEQTAADTAVVLQRPWSPEGTTVQSPGGVVKPDAAWKLAARTAEIKLYVVCLCWVARVICACYWYVVIALPCTIVPTDQCLLKAG